MQKKAGRLVPDPKQLVCSLFSTYLEKRQLGIQ